MTGNLIKIFTLIGAISAGGVAHANSGYGSGHHELPDRNATDHSTMMRADAFEHLDSDGDGTITRSEAAMHRQNMHASNMMTGGNVSSSGPLPPAAGNDR
ncbi:hypothetical protein [Roseovarius spongiae]|uniref:hypothetical protein n=1 Tax=Roseovarius spongiae TaxID=2320272 RepID=UPI0011C383EB|nr:hypothetical protein [Roseovarius spongiae]